MVAEVDLARPAEAAAGGDGGAPKGASKILGKLGKLGKLAKKGAKYLPTGGATAELDTSGQEVSDHFKPLSGAVAEVDGVPPALDAAVASLTALSSVLQTVTASPDAEQAIKDQGGLAELTGAVANQAAVLPPPLDEWLAGIAGDTTSITEQAVVSKLNAIWKADVLPFCKAALAGRYPFDAGSAHRRQHRRLRAGLRPRRPDRRLHQRPPAALRRHRRAALALARRPRPRRRRARLARARPRHPRRAVPRRRRADHGLHPRAQGSLAQRQPRDAEPRRPVAGLLQQRHPAGSR